MPHFIKWNKAHTKVKVWSTIVDNWVTEYGEPRALAEKYPSYRDRIIRDSLNECPFCERPMTPRQKSEYELAVMKHTKD